MLLQKGARHIEEREVRGLHILTVKAGRQTFRLCCHQIPYFVRTSATAPCPSMKSPCAKSSMLRRSDSSLRAMNNKKCRGKAPGSLTGLLSKVFSSYIANRIPKSSIHVFNKSTGLRRVAYRSAEKDKTAGEVPLAVGSPLKQDDQLVYITTPFLRGVGSQALLPELLKVCFLEIPFCAEESAVRRSLFMMRVLRGNKLDAAHVIGDLGESVFARTCVSVYQGWLSQDVFKRPVKGARYYPLAIVIVDFDERMALKGADVLEKKGLDVSLQLFAELATALILALSINQCLIPKWQIVGEHFEAKQLSVALRDVHVTIVSVAVQERGEVHRHIFKASRSERLLIRCNVVCDIVFLVMENKSKGIVNGVWPHIAGFIHKHGELAHVIAASAHKNAGGYPPALGRSPYVETHQSYTTIRSVESSIHVFKRSLGSSVQCRKAA